MRRILTVLLLLAIIAAAAWMLLNWERKVSYDNDPWRAIPDNSAVIISIPDAWITWDRFTHTSQVWGAFEQMPAFAAAGRLMARTIERMQDDAALRRSLTDAPMLICMLPGSDSKSRGLFIGTPNSEAETPILAFSELMGLDAAARNSLLKGETVQIRPDTALPALSLCLRDRLWLMATSTEVMDEALLQLDRPSALLGDSLFLEVRGTVGAGADAHLLVHLQRAAKLLENLTETPLVENAALPDGWGALDVRARPDAILMSGLLATSVEYAGLRAIRTQGAGRFDLDRVLPSVVTGLDVWHVNDPAKMFDHIVDQDITEHRDALAGWIDGSVGLAWAEKQGGSSMQWAIFQTSDIAYAATSIASLCDPAIGCVQQEYRGNVLQQIPIENAIPQLFGERYAAFKNVWWTILGDVVLFSPDIEALKLSIDAWSDGNSLGVEPRTIAWQQQISSNFGRMFWLDAGRSKDAIKRRSDGAIQNDPFIEKFLDQIGIVSVQISPGQHGFFHVVAGIQHAPLEQKENGVLWETEVGALVQRMPFVVRNHTNKTNEILVQDVNNKIHLIGSTGKLLWSREIDGPIMGDVKQIDRFKNGKLQLLFNTADRLHLIDRNGKDVGEYPIRLREKAAVPLAVFDYDDDREYRILIPTVEGNILNFGADGMEVKGWAIPQFNASAACSVHHLRIKNKDYLVLADSQGHVHILDRRGNVRERTALDLGVAPVVESIIPGSEIMASYIIWKDTSEVLQQGSFGGSVLRLSSEKPGTFSVLDIDADGKQEIARMNADSLTVFRDGVPLFTRTYGTPVSTDIRSHGKIGGMPATSILRAEARLVSLIDPEGNPIPGSAVEGTVSPAIADLNLDEILEIITINGSGKVVAYSLNVP